VAVPIDRKLLDLAVDIVREAGELTLKWYQSSSLMIERKTDGTPVTEADRAAEQLIRSRLIEAFPDDSLTGEEQSDRIGSSGRTWYIDPIDGTKAFSRGVPLYSNLLALVEEGASRLGVINLPVLGETVYAGEGLGCFYNGTRCQVSATTALHDAYVSTSGITHWDAEVLDRVQSAGCKLRTWGDGYGYALVATGRMDAMIDPIVEPYDIAAMPVILREAGGEFTDVEGQSGFAHGSGLGTNGHLHERLLELLRRRR
jgi:histidinol-phosphatase